MVGLIDRERESRKILEVWNKRGPTLSLIYGRRRIGKTYFLQHFLKEKGGIYFLAADSTDFENLGELLDQVRRVFPDRDDATITNYPTWRNAFRLLCELAAPEPLLVVLDEFGYLARADPSIPSVLQAVWDNEAKDTQLKLVLCGSELGVLSSLDDCGQPLHGRFDWVESYEPLDYYDAGRFLAAAAPPEGGYSEREKLVAYGIYGGSGRYLAEVDPGRPLGENVADQILDPSGIFHREGETLLRQEREIRGAAGYNAVLATIAGGETEWGKIISRSHVETSSLAAILDRLQRLGWVDHETPFGEPRRRGTYRIADSMLAAWYRWVFRYRSALETMPADQAWRELVAPDIANYMGSHVFEKVARQHMSRFYARYGLPAILEVGRWWNRKSNVEIDPVLRLLDGSYLYGSCKWATSPVPVRELTDLKAKVHAVPHEDWKKEVRYVLFSGGSFDPRLEAIARAEDVLLIGARELFV